jgi:hypothetical protein
MESITDGFREGTPKIILNGCLTGRVGINWKPSSGEFVHPPLQVKYTTPKYLLHLIETSPPTYY